MQNKGEDEQTTGMRTPTAPLSPRLSRLIYATGFVRLIATRVCYISAVVPMWLSGRRVPGPETRSFRRPCLGASRRASTTSSSTDTRVIAARADS